MWRICSSENNAVIVGNNGFSPAQRQATILTNADLLSIGILGKISVKKANFLVQGNACESFGCKIRAILSWPQGAKQMIMGRYTLEFDMQTVSPDWLHGPFVRYVKLRVRMRRECRESYPRHRR